MASAYQQDHIANSSYLLHQLARQHHLSGLPNCYVILLGTLTLDREMSTFEGTCKWMGKEVHISLDVEVEKKASWTRVTNVMKKLLADQEVWDLSLIHI